MDNEDVLLPIEKGGASEEKLGDLYTLPPTPIQGVKLRHTNSGESDSSIRTPAWKYSKDKKEASPVQKLRFDRDTYDRSSYDETNSDCSPEVISASQSEIGSPLALITLTQYNKQIIPQTPSPAALKVKHDGSGN